MEQYRKTLGKVVLTCNDYWDKTKNYDILCLVEDKDTNKNYISKKKVPAGVLITNREYWQPIASMGAIDNGIIILNHTDIDGNIPYYDLISAAKSINPKDRRPGLVLGYLNYDSNTDDLPQWKLYQYNDVDLANWLNISSWQALDYNKGFVGWFPTEEELYKEYGHPKYGMYAYVGEVAIASVIYRADDKNDWVNTGEKAFNYIVNFADEEDITNKNNKLKFADKIYNPKKFNGLGRTYLRKNIVDGVNVLTQDMMSKSNTIYIIQYDYDLKGAEITIPEGCILDFQGGSLSNGIINANDTEIKANGTIFYELQIKGNVSNSIIEADWFNFTHDYSNNTSIFRNLISLPKIIHFKRGVYEVNLAEDRLAVGCVILGDNYFGEREGTLFKVKEENTSCRYLLGLSYRSGLRNLSIWDYSSNRDYDLILADTHFGMQTSDWQLSLSNIYIEYAGIWLLGYNNNNPVPLNNTSIHFRHTDNDIYNTGFKPGTEGFSYGENFDHIISKMYHVGIKITTGYTTKEMWMNSVYFSNIQLWSGWGFLFVRDPQSTTHRDPARLIINGYMYQKIYDSNCPITLNDGITYNIPTGFVGKVISMILNNYDCWDTNDRGAVNGIIYQISFIGPEGNKYFQYYWHKYDNDDPNFIITDGNPFETLPIIRSSYDSLNSRVFYRIASARSGMGIYPSNTSKEIQDSKGKVFKEVDGVFSEIVVHNNGYTPLHEKNVSPTATTEKYTNDPIFYINDKKGQLTTLVKSRSELTPSEYYNQIFYSPEDNSLQVIVDGKVRGIDSRTPFKRVYNTVEELYNDYTERNIGQLDIGKVFVANNFPYISHNRSVGKIVFDPVVDGKTLSHIGASGEIPNNSYIPVGFVYLVTTDNGKPIWWDGEKWIDYDGSYARVLRAGNTENRPSNVIVGFQYFDATLNKPIWWTGSKWVDATGAEV